MHSGRLHSEDGGEKKRANIFVSTPFVLWLSIRFESVVIRFSGIECDSIYAVYRLTHMHTFDKIKYKHMNNSLVARFYSLVLYLFHIQYLFSLSLSLSISLSPLISFSHSLFFDLLPVATIYQHITTNS